MKSTQIIQNPTTQVFFMPRVFDETMQLLLDAREYFTSYGEDDQSHIDANMKAIYASEMSRITLRLSAIMAWIMVQRAVLAGKISEEDARTHYGLDFKEACLVDSSVLQGVLPSYVCHLLDRTHQLYSRVERLDTQFKQLH